MNRLDVAPAPGGSFLWEDTQNKTESTADGEELRTSGPPCLAGVATAAPAPSLCSSPQTLPSVRVLSRAQRPSRPRSPTQQTLELLCTGAEPDVSR